MTVKSKHTIVHTEYLKLTEENLIIDKNTYLSLRETERTDFDILDYYGMSYDCGETPYITYQPDTVTITFYNTERDYKNAD